MMIQMIPKPSGTKSFTHPPNDAETTQPITNSTPHVQMFAAILKMLSTFRLIYFCDLFFRTSGGYTPWTDVGIPLGTLGPIFLNCWKKCGTNLLQMSKTPEQHFDTS